METSRQIEGRGSGWWGRREEQTQREGGEAGVREGGILFVCIPLPFSLALALSRSGGVPAQEGVL
jgi:hypothetical protein